jgi:hypothetical protein
MTQAHLSKLFGAVGLVLLVVAVNTWLASQGANPILSIPLLSRERPAMAFLGLALVSLLLGLTCSVGLLHARRYGNGWASRSPVVWLDGLNVASPEGTAFQAAVLFLFIAVPVAAAIHFADIVWTSKLCVLGSKDAPVLVSQSWFSGFEGTSKQIRLVADLGENEECNNGIQVFPPWEFLFVAALAVCALSYATLFMLTVVGLLFGGHRTRPPHSA